MVSMIVAITRDGAIGKDGDQLYYITGDLKRFKELTTGNSIIMGSATFNALPKGALPNRKNIVLSSNTERRFPGATVVRNIPDALNLVENEAFIIGGESVYRQFLPVTQRLYLTVIETERPDADKFFPTIDPAEWRVINESELLHDDKNGVDYRYITLERL